MLNNPLMDFIRSITEMTVSWELDVHKSEMAMQSCQHIAIEPTLLYPLSSQNLLKRCSGF